MFYFALDSFFYFLRFSLLGLLNVLCFTWIGYKWFFFFSFFLNFCFELLWFLIFGSNWNTGFLLVFENRALEVLMKRTTGGLHGWNLCSERASSFNASCTLIPTRVNAICTAWIAWTVLSALSVSITIRTTVLFRYHFLSLNSSFSSLFGYIHCSQIWVLLYQWILSKVFFFPCVEPQDSSVSILFLGNLAFQLLNLFSSLSFLRKMGGQRKKSFNFMFEIFMCMFETQFSGL